MTLQAFHNDKAIKARYLDRVIGHQKSDRLIRGEGWNGTKGCAVGCTLEAYEHKLYETELGIPEWLARVEDTIFEGMTEEKSRTWPEVFLKAVPVGFKNWDRVKLDLKIVILKRNLKSMDAVKFDSNKFPNVAKALDGAKAAVKQMITAEKSRDKNNIEAAKSAARSAARSAESAAWSARSAAWSAWSAAWSAARSAAWSAESAAWSAESAADYDYFADELIKTLKKQWKK